jgi:endonuclease-3
LFSEEEEREMGKGWDEKRVKQLIEILESEYPNAKTALHFTNSLELLVATVLSAQCTDERVNKVTQDLFTKYRSAEDYARVYLGELEEDIRPTGFFRNKSKAIKSFCTDLVEKFNGKIPDNLEDLVSLSGIGRKTANLVLGEAYGIPGVVVDTHVLRLSKLIGLTKNTDPTKVEFDLMEVVPRDKWIRFSNLLILHGRAICIARRPKSCTVAPSASPGDRNTENARSWISATRVSGGKRRLDRVARFFSISWGSPIDYRANRILYK